MDLSRRLVCCELSLSVSWYMGESRVTASAIPVANGSLVQWWIPPIFLHLSLIWEKGDRFLKKWCLESMHRTFITGVKTINKCATIIPVEKNKQTKKNHHWYLHRHAESLSWRTYQCEHARFANENKNGSTHKNATERKLGVNSLHKKR